MCEFPIGYGAKSKGLEDDNRVKQGVMESKREMGKKKKRTNEEEI